MEKFMRAPARTSASVNEARAGEYIRFDGPLQWCTAAACWLYGCGLIEAC